MNARQKAKRYKHLYEELVNRPVEFKVEEHKIDTLRFERHYPRALVMSNYNSYFQHCICKDIAYSLAESLDKYIDYSMEFCPHTNEYRFVGEIKVVEKGAKE